MLAWLSENMATIIVCAIVFGFFAVAVVRIVRDRKKGKNSCGCGCADCPMNGRCHS